MRMSGVQSVFQLTLKVFDRVVVGALCTHSFYSNLCKRNLYGPHFVHRGTNNKLLAIRQRDSLFLLASSIQNSDALFPTVLDSVLSE